MDVSFAEEPAARVEENLTGKTAGTDQTERAELGAGDELIAMSEKPGAASVPMTWSGSFEESAQVSVSLNRARRVTVVE